MVRPRSWHEAVATILLVVGLVVPVMGIWMAVSEVRPAQVQSAGIWGTGEITGAHRCPAGRSGYAVGVEGLTVNYMDAKGTRQTAETPCDEKTTSYAVGDLIAVKYVPSDPGFALTRDDVGYNPGAQLTQLIWINVFADPVAVVLFLVAARMLKLTPASVRDTLTVLVRPPSLSERAMRQRRYLRNKRQQRRHG